MWRFLPLLATFCPNTQILLPVLATLAPKYLEYLVIFPVFSLNTAISLQYVGIVVLNMLCFVLFFSLLYVLFHAKCRSIAL